ncbi:MAG: hypothetical protein OXI75_08195 [Rhodospirillales bacterium]|nr:hypothetical protein [Rhodospirillales bacterium]
MFDESGGSEAGEARRLAEGKALLAVQSRGERAPYTLFGEKCIVVEVKQDGFGPVPLQNHDRVFAGGAQRFRGIVLQRADTDSFHDCLLS